MSGQKKTILLIIPNLSFGGAQVSFTKLSRVLSSHYTIINVVFNRDNIAEYQLGGELISLDVPASGNWLSKVYYFLQRVLKLRRVKKDYNISCAISFLEGADYVNILSKGKEKIIFSIRGSKYYDQNIKGVIGFLRHKFLIPYCYNQADTIVTLNKGVKRELIEQYNIKKSIYVVYNGFDIESIKAQSKSILSLNEQYIFKGQTIISHGRLEKEKGYHYLIDIFNRINIANKRLILIGDGTEKPHLIDLCKQYNLTFSELIDDNSFDQSTKVVFMGYKNNPYKYIRHAKLFVLPSLHEGFGNSLLEAMICDLPVVASDCPYGPREILGLSNFLESEKIDLEKHGYLLPIPSKKGSSDIWAKQIEKILNNNELRTQLSEISSTRSLKFALKSNEYEWNKVLNKLGV